MVVVVHVDAYPEELADFRHLLLQSAAGTSASRGSIVRASALRLDSRFSITPRTVASGNSLAITWAFRGLFAYKWRHAGGILALARGDPRARAALAHALHEGYVVVIPTPVLAQVHRGGRDRASIDRVVKAVDAFLPTSEHIARRAGELQAKASTSDVVDAIVVAEALASVPALILTTDPNDLSLLLEGEPEATRVALVRV